MQIQDLNQQSGSGVCAFNRHMSPPLTLKAGRQNKKAKVILETFLDDGTQRYTGRYGPNTQEEPKGKAGRQHGCKLGVNICTDWSGESTRQSYQDPGSTCHPPKDKEEGKAKPVQAERLH